MANVEVSFGDIFDVSADAIVSPANSFGFMDGGIDLVYTRRFGWDLQERLQALLRAEHAGELPVGQAVIVETYASDIPWLISAPTMRVPADGNRPAEDVLTTVRRMPTPVELVEPGAMTHPSRLR